MSTFLRILKAIFGELFKPKSFVKGEAFEDYLRRNVFPDEGYETLHRTHNINIIDDDFNEENKLPDFKFRSLSKKWEFWVEAKYRSKPGKNKIEWCKEYQLRRYRRYDKDLALFVALGVGGSPEKPSVLYVFPLRKLPYTTAFLSALRPYRVSLHDLPIRVDVLRNQLK